MSPEMEALASLTHLTYQVKFWKLIGLLRPETYKELVLVVVLHSLEIVFVITQIMAPLTASSLDELLLCSVYCLPVLNGFLRSISCYLNIHKLDKTSEHIKTLDEKAKMFKKEYEFIESAIKECQVITKVVFFTYTGCVAGSEIIATFLVPGRNFVSPSWIPFIDWQHNDFWFALLNVFLYGGLTYEATLSSIIDTEPPANMMLLISHIKALRQRVSRIGWDETKSQDENYKEFLECIRYHKLILELFNELSSIFSTRLIILYIMCTLSQCSFAISVIYGDPKSSIVFGALLLASILQTLIPCYYGDELHYENEKLAFALGDCNWVDQHKQFKKDLIFFTQNAQKPMMFLAGGCIPCSLDTFVGIQKLAYSVFVMFKN